MESMWLLQQYTYTRYMVPIVYKLHNPFVSLIFSVSPSLIRLLSNHITGFIEHKTIYWYLLSRGIV
jgi:hypothetical protein